MGRTFGERLSREVDDQFHFLATDIEHRCIPERMRAAVDNGKTDTPQVIFGTVGPMNLVAFIEFTAQQQTCTLDADNRAIGIFSKPGKPCKQLAATVPNVAPYIVAH